MLDCWYGPEFPVNVIIVTAVVFIGTIVLLRVKDNVGLRADFMWYARDGMNAPDGYVNADT